MEREQAQSALAVVDLNRALRRMAVERGGQLRQEDEENR
jgi:hypothetical protein